MSRPESAFIGTVRYSDANCKTCGDGKVQAVVNRYGEWVLMPCTECVAPLPKNWLMKLPSKIDGSRILVYFALDGRVFVDVEPEQIKASGRTEQLSRGGPEHSRHFHRFEDYGLADGLVRCKKCGLVKEGECTSLSQK